MGAVEDTSKRDPVVHLLGIMSDGQSNYIEGMEVAGQRQLVASTKFPTDRNRWGDDDSRWLALGFTFSEFDPHDPMFCDATLPEGWKREGSDHAMWSYIVDERGIRRVGIFYKAAFYDRSAHASLLRPGYEAANAFFYGEGERPDLGVLTAEERVQFAKACDVMDVNIASHPDIYKDRVEPLAEARAALAAIEE